LRREEKKKRRRRGEKFFSGGRPAEIGLSPLWALGLLAALEDYTDNERIWVLGRAVGQEIGDGQVVW